MKIIFIDHWGVMCLADKHGREHGKNDLPNITEMRIHGAFDNFDKEAVNILNSIIEETNAEIVISSDWKRWTTLEEMKVFYKLQGINKTPLDYTVNIKGFNRNLEIKEWLNIHKIKKWVAIDDIYLNDIDNFVWVSRTDEGITQYGIKQQLLNYLK